MYVIGYKMGANASEAIKSVHKHTGLSIAESKRLVDNIIAGEIVKLPDDFVLREDLVHCKFIIQ